MSIIVSTCQQINQSPLNASASKQLYSFSKAQRFPDIKQKANDKIAYDIPDTKERRSAGFGYGNRYDFTRTGQSPPPNAYTTRSDFTKSPTGKAFSFGISREAYDKVYVKGHVNIDKSIPGPGSYSIKPVIGNDSNKFTFRPRTTNPMFVTTTKLYPGPGSYDNKLQISSKGDYFMSKYKSSGATTFNPPKSNRFTDLREKEAKGVPGPGQYVPKVEMNDKGSYFVSKFKSSLVRTFSHSERITVSSAGACIFTKLNKIVYPGPGSYRVPSEFGYYESKFKNDVFGAESTMKPSKSQSKFSTKPQVLAKSSSQPEL